MPNRLAGETSPYLKQHANNPVDWYPWSNEAFERANQANKPIFLSIGYSSCHWCHVMEQESFSDERVGRLMNEAFINIKVDREERPDIDAIYMKVCQILTGAGGWPLTIIMTPDKKPFYATTYIPKDNLQGRLGLTEFIPKIVEIWKTRQSEIIESSEQIVGALNEAHPESTNRPMSANSCEVAYRQLNRAFDLRFGGFGKSPKFPTPHHLIFLLRYWHRTGEKEALEIVEKTLTAMRAGGIYDQLGWGFHRYSTDAEWLVPHFEKMLYDQALMVMAYIEAYQATGQREYHIIARAIIEYMFGGLGDEGGGFYSSEDADSEGEEGKFYLWKYQEIEKLLTAEEFKIAEAYFNLSRDGNYSEQATGENSGLNILHAKYAIDDLSSRLEIGQAQLEEYIGSIRSKLLSVRSVRERPFLDKKILADWNGLALAALAKAAWVLNDPKLISASKKTADFILNKMCDDDGRISHRHMNGESDIDGFIDDYAFVIWGLLEMYQASFESDYLKAAIKLARYMIDHFHDKENGGFFFTADNAEIVLNRLKEIFDSAMPSGNAVAIYNLYRLWHLTGDLEYAGIAEKAISAYGNIFEEAPTAYTFMLTALEVGLGRTREIAIVNSGDESQANKMLDILRAEYIPDTIIHNIDIKSNNSDLFAIAPYLGNLKAINGHTAAFICSDFACALPITENQKLIKAITRIK